MRARRPDTARYPWCYTAPLALLFLSASAAAAHSQAVATLEVKIDRDAAGLAIPVQVSLDPITHLPDSALELVEVEDNKRTPVSFHVEGGPGRKLSWLVSDNRKTRKYELIRNVNVKAEIPYMRAVKEAGTLTLKAGDRNLLRYRTEAVYPPEGIDTVFKRSAFIHPLWAPHGQELTRIQPPDHYHHYGLWNPWTHVLYEGDTVDFWNLNARQGTVRFGGLISTAAGNVFSEYSALHEHVVFPKNGHEKIALAEIQTVRTYAPQRHDYYMADITVQLNCVSAPVTLLEYRYGGLGWRATEQWTKENSRVLTSDGKTRKDADGSKARWCIVEGTVGGENAGAVLMSYPVNFNHPEPLRIWPENANGNRGDMFANFSPTKDMDWPLRPGKTYVLRYRLVVFNGTFSGEKAEAAWRDFAYPPAVTVTRAANPRH